MKIEKITSRISVINYVERFVDVEKFAAKCTECPVYGKKWSCPPFDFDRMEFWSSYKHFDIIGEKIYIDVEDADDIEDIFFKNRRRLMEELYAMEEKNPGSIALAAGSCDYCGADNCTRKKGEPCRFPDKNRYSIESVGGDVGRTASELLGVDLQWNMGGAVPEYLMTIGGLLTKE